MDSCSEKRTHRVREEAGSKMAGQARVGRDLPEGWLSPQFLGGLGHWTLSPETPSVHGRSERQRIIITFRSHEVTH